MAYKHFKTQKEYDAQRYKDNREKFLAISRQYKRDHIEETKAYQRQYHKDHSEELAIKQKQYHKDHPERYATHNHNWYMKNKDKKALYNKKYRKENSEYFTTYKKQYTKDHPEVSLKSQRKLRARLGISMYGLMAWTKVIRKGKNCSYCGSDKDLHSHHLIPKSKQPGLALNENNGIPLCATCHKEHHVLNGATA